MQILLVSLPPPSEGAGIQTRHNGASLKIHPLLYLTLYATVTSHYQQRTASEPQLYTAGYNGGTHTLPSLCFTVSRGT